MSSSTSNANDERNQSASLVVKFSEVSMKTPIFQSIGLAEGVCRGMVQSWIAAHFDSVRFGSGDQIDQWRKDATSLQKGGKKYFTAVHDDFEHDAKQLNSKSPRFLDHVIMLMSGMRSPGQFLTQTVDQVDLPDFFANILRFCKGNGFYYVGTKNHAMGICVNPKNSFFLDPNTSEWLISGKDALPKFLKAYVDLIYPTWGGRVVKTLFYYPGDPWV